MQESRLFKIVYYLLEHEKSTASELAEKFEVSVRTIYRDIDKRIISQSSSATTLIFKTALWLAAYGSPKKSPA